MTEPSVYTLAHLREWNRSAPSLAVIGSPIGHSVSPAMHNAALAQFADLAGWEYFRFEITPAELPEALAQFAARGFAGINLTVPHKVSAYELIPDRDASACEAQAINTLHFAAGQKPRGYSTDGYGLLRGLAGDFGFEPAGRTVLVLGAGGAGQSAVVALEKAGARIFWYNRTAGKVSALIPRLGLENTYLVNAGQIPWEETGLVINATSAGLREGDGVPVALPAGRRDLCAYDMVYKPAQTPFLREAAARGLRTANGLSMLLHQGAKAFEIWTKKAPPVEVMEAALKKTVYDP
ncbi:MAG: shikimate dehydrogenase [Verrucomicrobiae bacterium]|nr:shikimate dehydrogenase [Verrucomicrobiae bacterium]